MARKKKGGRGDDDDDDDDKFVDPIAAAGGGKKGGAAGKKQAPAPAPAPAAPAGNKKGGKKGKGGKFHDDDDDDDDFVDPIKAAAGAGGGGGKKGGGAPQQQQPPAAAAAAAQGNKKGGKKGKGGGKHQHDDDDDNDDFVDPIKAAGAGKKGGAPPPQQQQHAAGGKKQQGKKGKGKSGKFQHDDSDDDDDDDYVDPIKAAAAAAVSDSDDDDEEEEEEAPVAAAKNKKKGGAAAKLAAATAAAVADDSSDEEKVDKEEDEELDEELDEDDDDDDEPVEQVAAILVDDDWGLGKKSKKEKKEKKDKKEKKEKKDKKKHKHEQEEHEESPSKAEEEEESAPAPAAAAVVQPPPAVQPAAAAAPPPPAVERKKSKFELQMEAALQKKEAAATPEPQAPTGKQKNKAPPPPEPEPEPEPEEEEVVEEGEPPHDKDGDNEEEEPVQMYGIGDGTSTGNEPAAGEEDEDHALLYGPDGKKLSNKERKKILKQRQAAEREAEFEKAAAAASREGAQFACSQTAVDEKDPTWNNSLDVTIPSFSISAAGKILFQDAQLTIAHGRRYGLVGPNGKGKSTLLKMIASRDLKLPPRIDYLYVEQEVVADDTPAVEAVLRADTRRWDLMEEERTLMEAIDAGEEAIDKIERLQVVVDELTNMGADAAEARARRILYGLGFAMDMQTKPTKMFSGGWRMRISLARALFVEPTLLMLDEPTNHLDLNAVIWLEEYLKKWKKTLFVVSHDQDFLNSVCDEILHIENLKLASYKGNYDSFKKAEKIKFDQVQKAWEKQEKRLRELKKTGQMSKGKAQETVKNAAANSKKQDGGARAQKKKNQAVAFGTETVETKELIARPREYQVKFEFAEVAELNRPVMQVDNVHFRYSPKHPIIFEKVDFGIDMDSRITIVGPNGAGKSTLLKLLTGEIEPTRGEIKRNPRLRLGVYNQHFVDKLPMGKTPVEFLRDRFQEEDYQSVRNRLGKYGLEGHAHEVKMRDLSGGQKARVTFVELSLSEPHILLLDEPTNNLDIESIDALCDAINAFNGGVVVVTHDQRLIDECECTLWVVEKLGVTEWTEGFEDYKASILAELEAQVEKENQVRMVKLAAAAEAKAEKLALLKKRIKK